MTEMGLAVLQQLNKFEPSFEHGVLANLFERAGNTAAPMLRLVDIDNIEENLKNVRDEVLHKLDGLTRDERDQSERNVQSDREHTEEATFNYGTKDIIAPPSPKETNGNDFNISTGIGTIKGAHANQAGYNEKKSTSSWLAALRLINNSDDFFRRMEQRMAFLQSEIKRFQDIQDFLKDKTSADFNDGSARAEEYKAELSRKLALNSEGKQLSDFTDANGHVDIEAADKYARDGKRDSKAKLESTASYTDSVRNANNQSMSAAGEVASKKPQVQETSQAVAVTALASESKIADLDFDDMFASASDIISPTATADVGFSVVPLQTASQNVTQFTASSNATPRSFSSVASSMDGESSVLSGSFTKLAAGAPQEVAAVTVQPAPAANEPTYSTMKV